MSTDPLDLAAIMAEHADVEARWRRSGADSGFQTNECQCEDAPHENALHDLAAEDVPALLDQVKRLAADLGAERDKVRRVEWLRDHWAFWPSMSKEVAELDAALAGEGAVGQPVCLCPKNLIGSVAGCPRHKSHPFDNGPQWEGYEGTSFGLHSPTGGAA